MAFDLTSTLTNLSEIVTAATSWFISVMEMVFNSPLVIFVGIGIFTAMGYAVVHMIRGTRH